MKIEATRTFYIYILTNHAKDAFETGVAGDLGEKLSSAKYTDLGSNGNGHDASCQFLVHYEHTEDPVAALDRERQIRGYSKKRKTDLINQSNPSWRFLNEEIKSLDPLTVNGKQA